MPIALTSFFATQDLAQSVGWSETMFLAFNDLNAGQNYLTQQNNYLQQRCAMLGAGVRNTFNRLSLPVVGIPPVGPQRRAVITVAGLRPQLGDLGPFYNPLLRTFVADYTPTVLLLRMSVGVNATPQYIRNFWVAALPDDALDPVQPSWVPGPWAAAITSFKAFVANGGVCLLRDVDRTIPAKLCTAFAGAPTIYTVNAHGFVEGQRVLAVGWVGIPGQPTPRGQYRVTNVTVNSFELQGANNLTAVKTLGSFRPVSYVFNTILNVVEDGITNKKKGRPFPLLVGRRRTPIRPRA